MFQIGEIDSDEYSGYWKETVNATLNFQVAKNM